MDVCIIYQAHYSRLLSVHMNDMTNLLVNHPNICAESQAGNIDKHTTSSKFSAMTIDQCHEQDNGAVKVSDTQEPWQSLKWQDKLQHLKRSRWPEDQQSNKTLRIFTMKATWSATWLPQSRQISHSCCSRHE